MRSDRARATPATPAAAWGGRWGEVRRLGGVGRQGNENFRMLVRTFRVLAGGKGRPSQNRRGGSNPQRIEAQSSTQHDEGPAPG